MMETDIAVGNTSAVGAGLRITCGRDELVERLGAVARAASTRGAVQVLAGILLKAEAGRLELAATDMELSLRTTLPAKVEGAGAVVVPAKLLVDITRLLPAAEVVIEHRPEDGAVHLSSGSYSSRLNVYAAEDFPRLPPVDVPLHSVSRESLLETIDRVSRAASRDESRPVLTGILVRFERATLVMAATDSYRMSVKETALGEPGPDLDAIIPARALTELTRLATADAIEIGVQENHVVFGTGDAWLTTRRIDGQFPNYKQLRPESFEVELSLPRQQLLEIIRRAGVIVQRNSPLRLRFAEGELTVSAQSQDVGETTESLAVPQYTGEPLEIGFNAEFLREGLESVKGDEVQLQLINPLRPGLLSAEGDAFWYLIMPIRLAG
jgi:DNA polymerase-3 subunit beta